MMRAAFLLVLLTLPTVPSRAAVRAVPPAGPALAASPMGGWTASISGFLAGGSLGAPQLMAALPNLARFDIANPAQQGYYAPMVHALQTSKAHDPAVFAKMTDPAQQLETLRWAWLEGEAAVRRRAQAVIATVADAKAPDASVQKALQDLFIMRTMFAIYLEPPQREQVEAAYKSALSRVDGRRRRKVSALIAGAAAQDPIAAAEAGLGVPKYSIDTRRSPFAEQRERVKELTGASPVWRGENRIAQFLPVPEPEVQTSPRHAPASPRALSLEKELLAAKAAETDSETEPGPWRSVMNLAMHPEVLESGRDEILPWLGAADLRRVSELAEYYRVNGARNGEMGEKRALWRLRNPLPQDELIDTLIQARAFFEPPLP
ncbi:MAG: hypothetical protein HYZ75_04175 [Elusimicrobia bacterium]|nr:hypothetical protein [Elusimicrobiota bacterium]